MSQTTAQPALALRVAWLLLPTVLVACDVDRGLDDDRFACSVGGPCTPEQLADGGGPPIDDGSGLPIWDGQVFGELGPQDWPDGEQPDADGATKKDAGAGGDTGQVDAGSDAGTVPDSGAVADTVTGTDTVAEPDTDTVPDT